jgi:hypothetical protein
MRKCAVQPSLAWRSRAAPGRLAAHVPAHCRIVTKTFDIVHILVASETAEHRLPQQADRRMATVLAGPRIGEHVACQRGQSKCVVKFVIAQFNLVADFTSSSERTAFPPAPAPWS